MTEDERKTIEYWKEKLKSYKKEIEQRQNDEFKGYGTDEDIAKFNYCNIHIMLNLIEKQQAEIKKYKEMYAVSVADRVNSAFKQEHKNNEDLEMLYKGCQIELEKKDKIIDEMAKVLADYKYEELICMEVDCEHIELQNEGRCIGDEACIKEYFKKKVEDK